jgi:large subunit GTPase 1
VEEDTSSEEEEEDISEEEEKEFEPLFDDLKKKIDFENELKEQGKAVPSEE